MSYQHRFPPGTMQVLMESKKETHLAGRILAPLFYKDQQLTIALMRVDPPSGLFKVTPAVFIRDAWHAPDDYRMQVNAGVAKSILTEDLSRHQDRCVHQFGIVITHANEAHTSIVRMVVDLECRVVSEDGDDLTGVIMWQQSPIIGEPHDALKSHVIFSQTWEAPKTQFSFSPHRRKQASPQPTPEGGEQMKDQKNAPPPFIRAVVVRDSEPEFAEGDSLTTKRHLRAYLEPSERTDNELRAPKSGEQVRFLISQEGTRLEHVAEAKLDPRTGRLVAKVEINDEPLEWVVSSPNGQPQRVRETHGEWPEKTNPSIQFAPTEPSGSATASGAFLEIGPDDLPPSEAPPLRLPTPVTAMRMVTPSMVDRAPATRARPEPEPPPPLPRYDEPPKAPKIDTSSSLAWDESKTNPQGWKVQQELIQRSLEGEAMPPPTAPAAPEVRQSAPPPPPPPPPPPAIEEEAPADDASSPFEGWKFGADATRPQPQPPPIPAEEPKEQAMTQKDQPPTRTVAASEVIPPPKPAPAPAPAVEVNVVQQPAAPQPQAAVAAKGIGLGGLGLYAAKVAIALVIAAVVGVWAMYAYNALTSEKGKPKDAGKAEAAGDAGKTGILEPPPPATPKFGDARDDQSFTKTLSDEEDALCRLLVWKDGKEKFAIKVDDYLAAVKKDPSYGERNPVDVDPRSGRPLVIVKHKGDKVGITYVARWTPTAEDGVDCSKVNETP